MALAEDHNYALAAEPAQTDNLGHSANRGAHTNILDPGFDLTLRPMRYPHCLLYTSPSPRDMRRSRMPSSA